MNEKYVEALEQYEMDVISVRKGRGSWICETRNGCRLLKEYRGTVKRLEFEDEVLGILDTRGSLRADRYIRNKEGSLLTMTGDGTRYILKDWFMDRECNIKDGFEIRQALSRLAMLHGQLRTVEFKEEWSMGSILSESLEEELERHNREMQRTRNYIRGKRKKSEFELCVIGNYNMFYEQALEAVQGIKSLWTGNAVDSEYDALEAAEIKNPRGLKGAVQPAAPSDRTGEKPTFLCHGDLDQHHVLMGPNYTAIIEYNRMHLGIQVSDLYRFMRKVMEKHGWNVDLGLSMLDSYERILPMDRQELTCLYYLFLYPEKYWKQLNFYYNANKAWIPGRNIDKLHGLEEQQQQRNHFLKRLQADCGV
ncbi:spore coat protein CotS [Clostridium sp. FS41]|uniref:spore coat protein CotS n=1 Tax=Clostridium sp. FS41 TaxID=1609975 RepID=UPI0005D3483E|nr:spore coat protein CotS [Clostridium sp. FS41]KJJ69986.1 hypothetical protein CLFS41_33330 [Clostridium sp. FS41]